METKIAALIAGLLTYQALIHHRVLRTINIESINSRVLFARGLGVLLFGGLAYYLDGAWPEHDFVTLAAHAMEAPYVLLAAGMLLAIMAGIFRNEKNRKGYPQLQFNDWTFSKQLLNTLTWGIYLFSYEWLWRGSILRLLTARLSTTSAVFISAAAYSVYHLFKTKREAAGALPMGLLLGYLSIRSESFLPAFLLHWMFACGSEAICLLQEKHAVKKTSLT